MTQMKKILTALALMLAATVTSAGPAEVGYFDGINTCFDADGNQLQATTESHIVITNNGRDVVNVVRTGTCPTTSKKAVNFDHEDYPEILGCDGGSAGLLPYWKYHMRPDGQYTLTCQSH